MGWHRCEHFWRWGHPCPYSGLPRHDADREERRDPDLDEPPNESIPVDIPIVGDPGPPNPTGEKPGVENPIPIHRPIPVIPPIPIPLLPGPVADPDVADDPERVPDENDPEFIPDFDEPEPAPPPVPTLIQLLEQLTDPDFAEVFEDFSFDDIDDPPPTYSLRTQEMISFYGLEIATQFMQMMAVVWAATGAIAEEQLAAFYAAATTDLEIGPLGPDLITFVAGDAGAEIWEVTGVVGALIATTYIAFQAFRLVMTGSGGGGIGFPFPAPTFRPDDPVFNPREIQELVDDVAQEASDGLDQEVIEEFLNDAGENQSTITDEFEDFLLDQGGQNPSENFADQF